MDGRQMDKKPRATTDQMDDDVKRIARNVSQAAHYRQHRKKLKEAYAQQRTRWDECRDVRE